MRRNLRAKVGMSEPDALQVPQTIPSPVILSPGRGRGKLREESLLARLREILRAKSALRMTALAVCSLFSHGGFSLENNLLRDGLYSTMTIWKSDPNS